MKRNKGTNHERLCSKTRLVSLLLCIVMILGMLPVGVFAAGTVKFIVTEDGTATIISYTSTDAKIKVPDEINGYQVTVIGSTQSVFEDCENLETLILPNSLKKISHFALSDCKKLKEVVIGTDVTEIQLGAFYNCSSLKDIYYVGSSTDWENINISGSLNGTLSNVEIHYNYVMENDDEVDEDETQPSSDVVEFNGHYYKLYSIETSATGAAAWAEAKAHCEELGGYLAVISSQEENDFLRTYISSINEDNAYFGFTDEEEPGVWKWVDAPETSDYINWGTNEPNGSSEHYAMFYYGNSYFDSGKWNDGNFGGGTVGDDKNYICEWISDENVPEDIHPTVENFTVNGQSENVTVEVGEQITLGGSVNGNGNNLKAVSVAIRLLADETRGGEWHTGKNANGEAINQNIESFDLADFNETVVKAGEDFGNTTLNPGTYVVQAYATNQDGKGFEAEHRITMTIVEKQEEDDDTVLLGDVNSDGEVTSVDRFMLGRYIEGIDGYLINKKAADINKDGSIDQIDYDILSKYLAGIDGYEDLYTFDVNNTDTENLTIKMNTAPIVFEIGGSYIFNGEITATGRTLDFVKVTVYDETTGTYCDYAIYDANAIETYGSFTSFDLSNVPAIVTGKDMYIGTSGSGYASEGSQTLYLDKTNCAYRIEISARCIGTDELDLLAKVHFSVEDAPFFNIYDEYGNSLNGEQVFLEYDDTNNRVVYVETNIPQISGWNDASNNFRLSYEGESLTTNGNYLYTYRLVASVNPYGHLKYGEIRFYETTDTNGTVTSQSRKLASFDVSQGANPTVPVIAGATIADNEAYHKANPLHLEVGDHNYQNGYTLTVNLKAGSPTENVWTIYTDNNTVASAYSANGLYYVHAKKEGMTGLYISHIYADNLDDIDPAFVYKVCDVYVGTNEPDAPVAKYRLSVSSDYHKVDMGFVLLSPDDGVISVGITDETTGETYLCGELSNIYDIKCEIYNREIAEKCGFEFVSGDVVTYIEAKENANCGGCVAELILKNKQTGQHEDTLEIWYANTYRKGLAGTDSYTSHIVKLDKLENVTAEHGFVLRREASTEVEIYNVQYTLHSEKTKQFPNGYYTVTFEALNGTFINYGIAAYNAAGNQVGATQIIAAYSPTTPLCRVAYEGGKAVLDIVTLNWEESLREFETQKTYVSIDVPVDGYIAFECGADNLSVEVTNCVDLVLATIKAYKSLKEVLRCPSLTDYTYINKQTFTTYLIKNTDSAFRRTLITKFRNGGIEAASNYLVGAKEYDGIIDALRESIVPQSFVAGVKQYGTPVAASVEKGLTFLNPVAYAVECTVNETTAVKQAIDLLECWDDTNLLSITHIVMPNADKHSK